MTKREWVEKVAEDAGVELLVMDEYDEAIVGICWRLATPFVLYDREKIIEILVRDGCTEEEAIDHYEFNVNGGWVGDSTPGFVDFVKDEA